MKRTLLTVFLAFISVTALAQDLKDTIEIKKTFFGPVFLRYGYSLSFRELQDIMQSNPEASRNVKIAKFHFVTGTILANVGAFLVGYGLGPTLRGQEVEWGTFAVGAGLMVAAIPLWKANGEYLKKAVRIHNEKIRHGK